MGIPSFLVGAVGGYLLGTYRRQVLDLAEEALDAVAHVLDNPPVRVKIELAAQADAEA